MGEGIKKKKLSSIRAKRTHTARRCGCALAQHHYHLNIIFEHCLSNNHQLLVATMSESYKELENPISDACDAYSIRGNPKIKPLLREFNMPYEYLLLRIKGRDSRSTQANTNKVLDEAQK